MNIRKTLLAMAALAAVFAASSPAMASTYVFRQASVGIAATLATPTLGQFDSMSAQYGQAPFVLTPPASTSPAPFTFISTNPSVVSVAGNVATVVGVGSALITATQPGVDGFKPASASASVTVDKGVPVLGNFGTSLTAQFGAGPFALSAPTSISDGHLWYTSSNPAVATVSGNVVTVVGQGTTTITVTQAATENFTGATASTTLTVMPAPLPQGYFTHNGLTWSTRSAAMYNYLNAVTYCSGTFNGQTGWRLSTKEEMATVSSTLSAAQSFGFNTWNQKVGEVWWYTQLSPNNGSLAYDSSHGGHGLYVYCVKPA